MIEWEQDCLFTLNCPEFHASMSRVDFGVL